MKKVILPALLVMSLGQAMAATNVNLGDTSQLVAVNSRTSAGTDLIVALYYLVSSEVGLDLKNLTKKQVEKINQLRSTHSSNFAGTALKDLADIKAYGKYNYNTSKAADYYDDHLRTDFEALELTDEIKAKIVNTNIIPISRLVSGLREHQKTLNKLSKGKKIVKAADDSAGLAIIERLD